MRKTSLRLRSIAFHNGKTYMLIFYKGKTFIVELVTNNTMKIVREIPKKFWRFQIYDNFILATDDYYMNEITCLPINGGRGKKLTKNARYWHKVASTLPQHNYFIVDKHIFTFRNDKWIDLDDNPLERLPEEDAAKFFTVSYEGLHQHNFLNNPGEWELLSKIMDKSKQYEFEGETYWEDPDYRQICYCPYSKQIVLVHQDAYFVNIDGKKTQHKIEKKVWSVAGFDKRIFFYNWGRVIEMNAKGEITDHNINGKILRDQCLISNDNFLFFMYENGFYRYNGKKWENFLLSNLKLD